MWKQKIFFYLTMMNLQKYTSETKPVLPADNTDANVLATVNAWEHGDYLCKGFILNSLCDPLYQVYSEDTKYSKDLWEALDKKYRTEDSGTQKFVVAKFRQYQMVDSRPLMEQVAEVQTLLHEIHAEGMQLCETYQGNCIIDMLPPGWNDFKNYLKLKKKKMSLEDLIVKLRVESTNRENLGKGANGHEPNANMVEHQKQGKWKGRQDKGKGKIPPKNFQKFKNKNVQNGQTSQRFLGNCNFCHKPGHKAADCRSMKAQVNLSEADMCAVVTKANIAECHPKTWWYDTGATRHICMDREMFSTYIMRGRREATHGKSRDLED